MRELNNLLVDLYQNGGADKKKYNRFKEAIKAYTEYWNKGDEEFRKPYSMIKGSMRFLSFGSEDEDHFLAHLREISPCEPREVRKDYKTRLSSFSEFLKYIDQTVDPSGKLKCESQ